MQALEDNEISDRSIFEATEIEKQPSSGRFRFKTKLPDGSPLESEWIQESDKGKAGPLWAEAVRGQIVAKSEEAAARAKRQLVEQRRTQPVVPKIVGADGAPVTGEQSLASVRMPLMTEPSTPEIRRPSVAVDADPAAYIRVQFWATKERRDQLVADKIRIDNELSKVTETMIKWKGILLAMGEDPSIGRSDIEVRSAPSAPSTGNSVDIVLSSNPADASPDQDDNYVLTDEDGGRAG